MYIYIYIERERDVQVPESGYARYNTSGYGVSGYNTPASSGPQ